MSSRSVALFSLPPPPPPHQIHGAYSNKVLYHGLSLPLHPTEDWPKMQPGELLTEGMQTRSHVLELRVGGYRETPPGVIP